MIIIPDPIVSGSARFPEFSIEDRYGRPVIPKEVTWTLTNEDGDIINERENEVVTPALTMTIPIYGDDVLYADGYVRIITVRGVYDERDISDVPFVEQLKIPIEDLQ